MYAIDKFRQDVEKSLKAAGVSRARLEVPPEGIVADLAMPCFELAKKQRKNPAEIAKNLAGKTKPAGLVKEVEALGPYLNFCVDYQKLSRLVLKNVLDMKAKYGASNTGGGKKVIMEYVSANPIHPLHIGSGRNALIGRSMVRVLKLTNHKVRQHYYMNDVGLQAAKVVYGQSLLKDKKVKGRPDVWTGKIYAVISSLLEDDKEALAELKKKWPDIYGQLSKAFQDRKEAEEEVKGLLYKAETGDRKTAAIFGRLSRTCEKGFEKTFERLGIRFDSIDYESSFIVNKGVYRLVDELKKKGRLKVTDEGTWLIDLEKEGLPSTVLVRSNGTTLYLTRDASYTIWKFDKKKADIAINVIASEQDLIQKQLAAILKLLGKKYDLRHLSYGLVSLPGVKMSGRRGVYITVDEVLDNAVEKAMKVVEEKSPHLSKAEKKRVAGIVGEGALAYAILKVDASKNVVFDVKEALDFMGNTAPYLQYTHARAKSILRKAGGREMKLDWKTLACGQEAAVVKELSRFPEAVKNSVSQLSPHVIAASLFDIAQAFNTFYNSVPVLKAGPGVRDARLALVKATAQTLKNGLYLLGIDAPERM